MYVWRVEHHCSENYGHGPHCSGGCQMWDGTRPEYGSRLETPHEDPDLCGIRSHEVCGTLGDQFDLWWSRCNEYEYNDVDDPWFSVAKGYRVQRELQGQWFACLYEVPESFARVGQHQVCFDKSMARLVFKSQRIFPMCHKGIESVAACSI